METIKQPLWDVNRDHNRIGIGEQPIGKSEIIIQRDENNFKLNSIFPRPEIRRQRLYLTWKHNLETLFIWKQDH